MPRRGPRRRRKLEPDPLFDASVDEIVTALGVAEDGWDLLLVGDGSGPAVGTCCGWACVLVDRHAARRRLFFGAMSTGSVADCELLPYLQAVSWYETDTGRWLRHRLGRNLLTHVVTDSLRTAQQGSSADSCNGSALWTAMKTVLIGYEARWHWMGRGRTALNTMVDSLSRASRLSLGEVEAPKLADVYAANPMPPERDWRE